MAQAAGHGGAAQPAVLVTLADAQAAVRATKAPPGRVQANDILKACREGLQTIPGAFVNLDDDESVMFHWRAYLGNHTRSRDIFRVAGTGFLCEVFPEKEPNSGQLPGVHLRVDFIALRVDGSEAGIAIRGSACKAPSPPLPPRGLPYHPFRYLYIIICCDALKP